MEPSNSDPSGNSGSEDEEIHVVTVHVEIAKEKSEVVDKPKQARKRQKNESKQQRRQKIVKLRKVEQHGLDKQGCGVPSNKIAGEMMNSVREYIKPFPSYQSHYTRAKNPNRRYLSTDLNVRIMYNLINDFCSKKDVLPVTNYIYRRVSNTEFNLHFHAPNKDSCSNCDKYKFAKENLNDEAKLTIFDMGFMYLWDETTASHQQLHMVLKESAHIKASDATFSCISGQNQNWNYTLALINLVQSDNIEIVDNKFIYGHSFLPNDLDFGSIEIHS
ncbi:hypothetical protein PR048_010303 [Dryococelus australis]|uniref:Uncharacterized protein n=1 Tax=Dryococelus australis TaxID=614101 RepID=A0ABQ9I2D7_9NEOP|nr:hypothetical protein PR048_010303 [Dryococelus australis]